MRARAALLQHSVPLDGDILDVDAGHNATLALREPVSSLLWRRSSSGLPASYGLARSAFLLVADLDAWAPESHEAWQSHG